MVSGFGTRGILGRANERNGENVQPIDLIPYTEPYKGIRSMFSPNYQHYHSFLFFSLIIIIVSLSLVALAITIDCAML